MQLTNEQLLQLLGEKEIQIYTLKLQLIRLQQQNEELKKSEEKDES